MTICWRCHTETEMPLQASEGDTTVALCDVCMMAWLADDFSLLPTAPPYQPLLDPARESARARQSNMFDYLGGSP